MDEEKTKKTETDHAIPPTMEFENLKAQCEEYLNGWKRAKADLINFQKDEAKRFEDVAKYANKEFVKDIILVLDSFDLAIAAMGDKTEKGVLMIRSQLEDALKKHGLERIVISVGALFDPALHEAIASAESESPPGTVVEEVERGYLLNGRVIRPARVKVAK